jgi:hypothetical protein
VGQSLGKTHHTSVGDAHRDIVVFIQEVQDRTGLFRHHRGDLKSAALAGSSQADSPLRSQKMLGFGKDRFASDPDWGVHACGRHCPRVMLIRAAPESYEKASINDDVFHVRNPSF